MKGIVIIAKKDTTATNPRKSLIGTRARNVDVTLLALPARLATRQMDNALAKTASPASRVTGDDYAGQITKYL